VNEVTSKCKVVVVQDEGVYVRLKANAYGGSYNRQEPTVAEGAAKPRRTH